MPRNTSSPLNLLETGIESQFFEGLISWESQRSCCLIIGWSLNLKGYLKKAHPFSRPKIGKE